MPIPLLNELGLLPPGVHECTMDEIEERFARFQKTDQRIRLFEKLVRYVKEARGTGLAVALLHDPDVLIMDEPTSGLDPNQIRRFRGQVQQLREKKTLLISTHILHEMEMIADRVLLVSAGRLVFDGRPDVMRAQGSLEECFYRLTHAAC